jgi:hypothetical protein
VRAQRRVQTVFSLKQARIGKSLELMADGEVLEIQEVEASWTGKERKIRRFMLTFQVSWDDWAESVDPLELFHLDEEVRGTIIGGELADDIPIWIEARLHPRHHKLLSHDGVEDILDAAGEILDADLESVLRDVGSWYALNVSQEVVTGLKMGFSTTWDQKGAFKAK